MLKSFLLLCFGAAVASFSLGIAVHGGPLSYAITAIVIGQAIMFYALWKVATA